MKGIKLVIEDRIVIEGKYFRLRFEEEIERIEHRHLGNQINLDAKLSRLLGKDEARRVIGLRILLPVDEMLCRLDTKRIAQNPRPRMRRGTQSHNLRAEIDQPVILIVRFVMERDVDGHSGFRGF